MLKRIAEIKCVGLLHDANGSSHPCQKATLIYADNGRGKSTLASILRSASTGDAKLIADRKTIDGTVLPKVEFQFDSGHKVIFDNGIWSESRPELLVFDADFIERNVHSGGTVSTGHRKNLLEFALGESAVVARADAEKATVEAKIANDKVQSSVTQLSGHHLGITLTQFEKLPQVANVDAEIVDVQRRITAANNVAPILNKPVPAAITEPKLDIDGLFLGFAIALKDVHADAERIVRQHIAILGKKSAESWLSQGQQLDDSKHCPYCGQDTLGNELIFAYQTHFNAAYNDLKTQVATSLADVESGTSATIVESFAQAVKTVAAHAAAWGEQVPTEPITFDAATASAELAKLRALLLDLAQRKQGSPAESVGVAEDKSNATDLWTKMLAPMQAANLAIESAILSIAEYKSKLATDNVPQLQQRMQTLQATKRRYETVVIDLISQLGIARTEAAEAEKNKKNSREQLDALMTKTLEKYEQDINNLLGKFGASFSIKNMGANFRGGAPRSEYGLSLRGKDVSVEGGSPSFATALSEGDKRTLAFAFFIASTLTDAKLKSRIVVIDDPMCSLDMNRKHHTRNVLKKIHANAEQLIVLAHDIYFIRDFRDALLKENKTVQISSFQLTLSTSDYTGFAQLDVDKECESPYFKHHRLLNEFAINGNGDKSAVAKAIRPMLEGYLHRRFPGLIPKKLLFGEVAVLIRDAVVPNPLCHAQDLMTELNEINDYAGQFHHDTNPNGADAVVVVATELKTFVSRALNVVHKSTGAAS